MQSQRAAQMGITGRLLVLVLREIGSARQFHRRIRETAVSSSSATHEDYAWRSIIDCCRRDSGRRPGLCRGPVRPTVETGRVGKSAAILPAHSLGALW